MVNTPVAVFDAYVYAAQPDGGFGTEAMNGPATWFWPLVTWVVERERAVEGKGGELGGRGIIKKKDEASARASAWALAIRARCCTVAYSGMAIAARMPVIGK